MTSFAVERKPPRWVGAGPPRFEAAGFALLLVSLVWAPWPLGSNRPWAVGVLAILVWLGVAFAALASFQSHALDASTSEGSTGAGRRFSRWASVPAALLVAHAGLIAASLLGGLDGSPLGTIDPFQTRDYLLRTLTYAGAAMLVVTTVRTRARMTGLLAAIVAAGLLQAIAAVLLHAAGDTYEFLFTSFEQGTRAMGTFPSPDHLAGYMELCLSAGLGLLLSQWERGGSQVPAGWRGRLVGVLRFAMSAKMLLRLLLAVLVIALVLTRSRMGNGAFFLALGLAGGVLAVASRQLRQPAIWLVASMAVVDLIVIGQWVGLDHVVQRMERTPMTNASGGAAFGQYAEMPPEESIEQRLQVPLMSLRVVADRPWFGHGGGTYVTAFPPFKQPGPRVLLMHWDHAHNDYVQVACDTGWVGLALWVGIGVACALRAVRLLQDDSNRMNQGVGAAALMAVFSIGLHDMVDFNLHIPASALTFTVLLASVWALPSTSRRPRGGRSGRSRVSTGGAER